MPGINHVGPPEPGGAAPGTSRWGRSRGPWAFAGPRRAGGAWEGFSPPAGTCVPSQGATAGCYSGGSGHHSPSRLQGVDTGSRPVSCGCRGWFRLGIDPRATGPDSRPSVETPGKGSLPAETAVSPTASPQLPAPLQHPVGAQAHGAEGPEKPAGLRPAGHSLPRADALGTSGPVSLAVEGTMTAVVSVSYCRRYAA